MPYQFAPFATNPLAFLGDMGTGMLQGKLEGIQTAEQLNFQRQLRALQQLQEQRLQQEMQQQGQRFQWEQQQAQLPHIQNIGGRAARISPSGQVEWLQMPPMPQTDLQRAQEEQTRVQTDLSRALLKKYEREATETTEPKERGALLRTYREAVNALQAGTGNLDAVNKARDAYLASFHPSAGMTRPQIHYERDEKGNVTQVIATPDQSGKITTTQQPLGKIGATKTEDTSGLTRDAIEEAARKYNATGTLPPLGTRAGAMRTQILNRAGELSRTEGTLGTLAERSAFYRGNQAELTKLMSQRGQVLAFAQTAELNMKLAEQASDQAPRTSIPALNTFIVSGQERWLGDPAAARLAAATRTAAWEYARVVSSTTGASTNAARAEASELFNKAMTPEQIKSQVQFMRQEMNNRIRGYDHQIEMVRRNLQAPSGFAGPQAPPETTQKRRVRGPDGKLYNWTKPGPPPEGYTLVQ